jgi:excisionase family DNA binding protein
MQTDRELLSLPMLARHLRVTQGWLRHEAEAGRIPAILAGNRFLFSRSAVEAALLKRASKGVKNE